MKKSFLPYTAPFFFDVRSYIRWIISFIRIIIRFIGSLASFASLAKEPLIVNLRLKVNVPFYVVIGKTF